MGTPLRDRSVPVDVSASLSPGPTPEVLRILGNAQKGIITLDRDGRVSEACCTPAVPVDAGVPQVAPATALRLLAAIREVTDRQEPRETEFWLSDEHVVHVTMVPDEPTTAVHFERRTADGAEADDELHVLEHATVGMAILGLDGRFRKVNRAFCELLGYAERELAGMTVLEVTHADDQEEDLLLFEQLRAGSIPACERRKRYIRKDGQVRWVEITAFLARSATGAPHHALTEVRDITDRRHAEVWERCMRESNRTVLSLDRAGTIGRMVAPLVPAAAAWCIVDVPGEDGEDGVLDGTTATPKLDPVLQGVLARWRDPALAGEPSLVEALGARRATVLSLTGDDYVSPAATKRLRPLRALGTASAIVVPLAAGPGPAGTLVLGIRDSDGAYGEAALTHVDEFADTVSHALQNARQYREAQRAIRVRDELLGSVAHDLRSPLAAITTLAETLMDDDFAKEERRQFLQLILRSDEQAKSMIQDLMSISLLDTGRLRLELLPVSPAALIENTMELMAVRAREWGVHLRARGAADLPPVIADAARIGRVLQNLVENALPLVPSGSAIELGARLDGGRVVFTVADSGPGIPEQHLPHLFDRFWQAPGRGSGGVGLGLAIVKGFVEAHGGEVGVESQVGGGTTFSFSLPVVPGGRAPAVEAAAPARVSTPPERPIRVFVTDDHPAVRRGLRNALERSGDYEMVGEASTGEDAEDRVSAAVPDVVVMDLLLPGMSGLAAMERIVAEDPETRVLIFTGHAESSSVPESAAVGATGFVDKALPLDRVIDAVRTAATAGRTLGRVLRRPPVERPEAPAPAPAVRSSAPFPPIELDPREKTILALSAAGFTSEEIAKKVFYSPQTVNTYRARAQRRLGIKSKPELVRFALRYGLLRAAD
jgi:PAS domain S-box-containing protein